MDIRSTYFNFTRGQRNGLVVLIILMLILFLARFYPTKVPQNNAFADSIISQYKNMADTFNYHIEKESLPDMLLFCPDTAGVEVWKRMGFSAKQADVIVNYINKTRPISKKEDLKKIFVISSEKYLEIEPFIIIGCFEKKSPEISQSSGVLFSFNPNTASDDDLFRLGLNQGQIRAIRNYLSNGGVFNTRDDLKKIYSIPEKLFNKLYDSIDLPIIQANNSESITVTEINRADSAALEKIKGIGPATAGRIIRYRRLLGGFYSKQQLLDIPGVTSESYIIFEPYISVDTTLIVKLNINSATFEQLNAHPYITFDESKAIMAYRKLMKKFTSTEVLIKNRLINKSNYDKIKPYLEL